MPLHKRLFICGLTFVIVPFGVFVTMNALSDCVGNYAYAPFVLGIVNAVLTFLSQGILGTLLLLCIPLGFILCLWSYGVQKRNIGVSWLRIVGDTICIIVLIIIIYIFFLASLNSGRNKGPAAAVKSYINSLRAQAEIYYDANEKSYAGFCSGDQVSKIIEYVRQSDNDYGGPLCNLDETILKCMDSEISFAASTRLPRHYAENRYWCVDSKGFVGEVNSEITGTSCK